MYETKNLLRLSRLWQSGHCWVLFLKTNVCAHKQVRLSWQHFPHQSVLRRLHTVPSRRRNPARATSELSSQDVDRSPHPISACYDDFSSTLASSLPTSLPSNISITSMLSPSAEIKWFVSYFGKVFGWLVLQPTTLLARLQIPSLPLFPFRRIAFDKNIQKTLFTQT